MTPVVSIHCGDWRDVAASWPTPCVLICDPPYGIKHRRTSSHIWRNSATFKHRPVDTTTPIIIGDHDLTERNDALEFIGWTSAAVFGPKRIDRIPPWGDPRDILILDKGEGAGVGDVSLPWKPCWETIAIYGPDWKGHRGSGILRGPVIAYSEENAPNGRDHPNKKSFAVVLELVAKAPPGLPIVDPFGGTGIVGSACAYHGRDYYGAEIDPAYFKKMSDRLGVTNGPLFAAAEART